MEVNERTKVNARNHTITLERERNLVLRKILLDFGILFFVGFLVLAFYLWGTPYKRGFFCNDDSIMFPYKESTVTNLMLYIVGIGLPILSMCLCEWLRLRDFKGGHSRVVFKREVPAWLWEAYKVAGVFLFGCACQQLTTDIAKYSIGRLRPHFIAVCKPDLDCSLEENLGRYIESFTCLNNDRKMLKEMRLSFPSGHSSFSAYSMLYLSMYLQKRMTWRGSKLLLHAIQFLLMMVTWYTMMSRISDYKHHWSDVLVGASIGLIYAIVVFTFMSGLRKSVRSRQASRDAELHNTNGNGMQVAGWQV